MRTITVGQESSTPIELSYEDHGSGPPRELLAFVSRSAPVVA
jgi:hypothetical protein